MFYCDKCATKNGWGESFRKSQGKCEVCGETAICNDKHHSLLPIKEVPLHLFDLVDPNNGGAVLDFQLMTQAEADRFNNTRRTDGSDCRWIKREGTGE